MNVRNKIATCCAILLVVVLAIWLFIISKSGNDRGGLEAASSQNKSTGCVANRGLADESSQGGSVPARGDPQMLTKLSEREENLLRTWFKKDYSVETANDVGAICLRCRLSRSRIIELIGKPATDNEGTTFFYDFAPSQFLKLEFDSGGITVNAEVSGKPIDPSSYAPKG